MNSSSPASAGRQPLQKRYRRRKHQTPPGHPTDSQLIEAYLANGGKITRYATGVAEGAIRSSDQGLTASSY